MAEAHRRLQEERDARKELDQLPSSKLEDLRLEQEHDDLQILVRVGLRVNKRLEWPHIGTKQKISEFDIWAFEQLFNDEFDKRNVEKS